MDHKGGGDSEFNAQITRNILSGEMGPKRNVVLLNSGAALYLAGKVNTIEEGVELAEDIIDRGLAKKQLNEFAYTKRTFRTIRINIIPPFFCD